MIVPVDALLRREVEAHRLRFTCESCAHFDEAAPPAAPPGEPGGGRCSLGFPHEPHTRARFDTAPDLAFCKAFELS